MEFITKARYARNDELVARIRAALSPDLLKPGYEGTHPMQGHCYVASEAYYHLMGGANAGLKPKRMKVGDVVHWWLEDSTGAVIDPTHDQFDNEIDYSQGRGGGFLTAQPSKRALELIGRISKLSGAYYEEYEKDEYELYEEDEYDDDSNGYSLRWIYDAEKKNLHIWPVDRQDFEYRTHFDKIYELNKSGLGKLDFHIGYITHGGYIDGYGQGVTPELRTAMEKFLEDNPDFAEYGLDNPDKEWVIPMQAAISKTAGVYLDSFCYIDGELIIANSHHAAIVQDLVQNRGYTFEQLYEKPSLFGWIQHTSRTTKGEIQLPELRISLYTGLGIWSENRAREEAFVEEAKEAIKAHYQRDINESEFPEMTLWADGNTTTRADEEAYFLVNRQSATVKAVRVREANGYAASPPQDSWFLKFVYVPQRHTLLYWFAEGYYGKPHHYDVTTQAMEDYSLDWDDANEFQTGFYAAEVDSGYDVGWHQYQSLPLSEDALQTLLGSEILKMPAARNAKVSRKPRWKKERDRKRRQQQTRPKTPTPWTPEELGEVLPDQEHKPQKWRTIKHVPMNPEYITFEQFTPDIDYRWAYHPIKGLYVWPATTGFHLDWEREMDVMDGEYAGGVIEHRQGRKPSIIEYHAAEPELAYDGFGRVITWLDSSTDEYDLEMWEKWMPRSTPTPAQQNQDDEVWERWLQNSTPVDKIDEGEWMETDQAYWNRLEQQWEREWEKYKKSGWKLSVAQEYKFLWAPGDGLVVWDQADGSTHYDKILDLGYNPDDLYDGDLWAGYIESDGVVWAYGRSGIGNQPEELTRAIDASFPDRPIRWAKTAKLLNVEWLDEPDNKDDPRWIRFVQLPNSDTLYFSQTGDSHWDILSQLEERNVSYSYKDEVPAAGWIDKSRNDHVGWYTINDDALETLRNMGYKDTAMQLMGGLDELDIEALEPGSHFFTWRGLQFQFDPSQSGEGIRVKDGDRTIASLTWTHNSDSIHIDTAFVGPEYRNRGIFRGMFNFLTSQYPNTPLTSDSRPGNAPAKMIEQHNQSLSAVRVIEVEPWENRTIRPFIYADAEDLLFIAGKGAFHSEILDDIDESEYKIASAVYEQHEAGAVGYLTPADYTNPYSEVYSQGSFGLMFYHGEKYIPRIVELIRQEHLAKADQVHVLGDISGSDYIRWVYNDGEWVFADGNDWFHFDMILEVWGLEVADREYEEMVAGVISDYSRFVYPDTSTWDAELKEYVDAPKELIERAEAITAQAPKVLEDYLSSRTASIKMAYPAWIWSYIYREDTDELLLKEGINHNGMLAENPELLEFAFKNPDKVIFGRVFRNSGVDNHSYAIQSFANDYMQGGSYTLRTDEYLKRRDDSRVIELVSEHIKNADPEATIINSERAVEDWYRIFSMAKPQEVKRGLELANEALESRQSKVATMLDDEAKAHLLISQIIEQYGPYGEPATTELNGWPAIIYTQLDRLAHNSKVASTWRLPWISNGTEVHFGLPGQDHWSAFGPMIQDQEAWPYVGEVRVNEDNSRDINVLFNELVPDSEVVPVVDKALLESDYAVFFRQGSRLAGNDEPSYHPWAFLNDTLYVGLHSGKGWEHHPEMIARVVFKHEGAWDDDIYEKVQAWWSEQTGGYYRYAGEQFGTLRALNGTVVGITEYESYGNNKLSEEQESVIRDAVYKGREVTELKGNNLLASRSAGPSLVDVDTITQRIKDGLRDYVDDGRPLTAERVYVESAQRYFAWVYSPETEKFYIGDFHKPLLDELVSDLDLDEWGQLEEAASGMGDKVWVNTTKLSDQQLITMLTGWLSNHSKDSTHTPTQTQPESRVKPLPPLSTTVRSVSPVYSKDYPGLSDYSHKVSPSGHISGTNLPNNTLEGPYPHQGCHREGTPGHTADPIFPTESIFRLSDTTQDIPELHSFYVGSDPSHTAILYVPRTNSIYVAEAGHHQDIFNEFDIAGQNWADEFYAYERRNGVLRFAGYYFNGGNDMIEHPLILKNRGIEPPTALIEKYADRSRTDQTQSVSTNSPNHHQSDTAHKDSKQVIMDTWWNSATDEWARWLYAENGLLVVDPEAHTHFGLASKHDVLDGHIAGGMIDMNNRWFDVYYGGYRDDPVDELEFLEPHLIELWEQGGGKKQLQTWEEVGLGPSQITAKAGQSQRVVGAEELQIRKLDVNLWDTRSNQGMAVVYFPTENLVIYGDEGSHHYQLIEEWAKEHNDTMFKNEKVKKAIYAAQQAEIQNGVLYVTRWTEDFFEEVWRQISQELGVTYQFDRLTANSEGKIVNLNEKFGEEPTKYFKYFYNGSEDTLYVWNTEYDDGYPSHYDAMFTVYSDSNSWDRFRKLDNMAWGFGTAYQEIPFFYSHYGSYETQRRARQLLMDYYSNLEKESRVAANYTLIPVKTTGDFVTTGSIPIIYRPDYNVIFLDTWKHGHYEIYDKFFSDLLGKDWERSWDFKDEAHGYYYPSDRSFKWYSLPYLQPTPELEQQILDSLDAWIVAEKQSRTSSVNWQEWHESNPRDELGQWKAIINPQTNEGVWWYAVDGSYPFHMNVYMDWTGGEEWEATHSYDADELIYAQGNAERVRWTRPEELEELFEPVVQQTQKESHFKAANSVKSIEYLESEIKGESWENRRNPIIGTQDGKWYIGTPGGHHFELSLAADVLYDYAAAYIPEGWVPENNNAWNRPGSIYWLTSEPSNVREVEEQLIGFIKQNNVGFVFTSLNKVPIQWVDTENGEYHGGGIPFLWLGKSQGNLVIIGTTETFHDELLRRSGLNFSKILDSLGEIAVDFEYGRYDIEAMEQGYEALWTNLPVEIQNAIEEAVRERFGQIYQSAANKDFLEYVETGVTHDPYDSYKAIVDFERDYGWWWFVDDDGYPHHTIMWAKLMGDDDWEENEDVSFITSDRNEDMLQVFSRVSEA